MKILYTEAATKALEQQECIVLQSAFSAPMVGKWMLFTTYTPEYFKNDLVILNNDVAAFRVKRKQIAQ